MGWAELKTEAVKGRDHVRDLGIDGTIQFEVILKKRCDVMIWIQNTVM